MKWLASLLAAASALLGGNNANRATPAPLNTAIIVFADTYYAPVVADPDNFPFASAIKSEQPKEETAKTITKPATTPVPAPVIAPLPPAPILPPAPLEDPYVAKTEPIITWLNTSYSFKGYGSEGDRTLPELTFDREYWRMEIFSYWAPDVVPPKPEVQKDYFKIEVYEAGTDKLIATITSDKDASMHKFQSFKKAGKYYFKVYVKAPSLYEINFTVSLKMAQ